MKKLLIIALLLGLIRARQCAGVEYPPLPVGSGKPPVDLPTPGAKPIFAVWSFYSETLDVLEVSPDMVSWTDLPGPYKVRDTEYWVPVPRGYAKAFFRVRRDWGNPWVI